MIRAVSRPPAPVEHLDSRPMEQVIDLQAGGRQKSGPGGLPAPPGRGALQAPGREQPRELGRKGREIEVARNDHGCALAGGELREVGELRAPLCVAARPEWPGGVQAVQAHLPVPDPDRRADGRIRVPPERQRLEARHGQAREQHQVRATPDAAGEIPQRVLRAQRFEGGLPGCGRLGDHRHVGTLPAQPLEDTRVILVHVEHVDRRHAQLRGARAPAERHGCALEERAQRRRVPAGREQQQQRQRPSPPPQRQRQQQQAGRCVLHAEIHRQVAEPAPGRGRGKRRRRQQQPAHDRPGTREPACCARSTRRAVLDRRPGIGGRAHATRLSFDRQRGPASPVHQFAPRVFVARALPRFRPPSRRRQAPGPLGRAGCPPPG